MVETALVFEAVRVFERPEGDVDDRKIGVVVGVMLLLVVDLVRFRTLNDIADPVRGSEIPVIKKFGDACK